MPYYRTKYNPVDKRRQRFGSTPPIAMNGHVSTCLPLVRSVRIRLRYWMHNRRAVGRLPPPTLRAEKMNSCKQRSCGGSKGRLTKYSETKLVRVRTLKQAAVIP